MGRPCCWPTRWDSCGSLPHDLVEAFRSTLAEVSGADLLLHVVDGSDHDAETELATVRQVLDEIGAGEIPELIVINKADVASANELQRMRSLHPEAVVISAVTGEGIGQLEAAITKALADRSDEVELRIPLIAATCSPLSTGWARFWSRSTKVTAPRSEPASTQHCPPIRPVPGSDRSPEHQLNEAVPAAARAAPTMPASLRNPAGTTSVPGESHSENSS